MEPEIPLKVGSPAVSLTPKTYPWLWPCRTKRDPERILKIKAQDHLHSRPKIQVRVAPSNVFLCKTHLNREKTLWFLLQAVDKSQARNKVISESSIQLILKVQMYWPRLIYSKLRAFRITSTSKRWSWECEDYLNCQTVWRTPEFHRGSSGPRWPSATRI